jgi:hypothetical protein
MIVAPSHLPRLRRTVLLLLGAWLTAAFAATAALAQLTKITGTTVSLVPPGGFSRASDFAGLVNKESNATILVVEFPAEAHDQMAALFANLDTVKTNFARQRVTIDTLETLDLPAGKAPLAIGTQTAGPLTFDKWVALLKGPKIVLLTVQAPQDAKLETQAVKAMLKTVVLGEPPSIDEKLATLPFTLTVSAPFRVIDTLGGLGVLMTVGPLNTDPADVQPSIIIAYQATPGIDAGNIEAISDTMLRGTRGYAEASIASKEPTKFAGVRGLRTRGTRKTSSGAEKQFIHDLAIAPGRHIRLISSADEQQMRELQPAIDAIAKSIAFKGK